MKRKGMLRIQKSENMAFDQLCGPEITALMHRDDVTEIYVNDDGLLRFESQVDGKVKTNTKLDARKVQAIIEFVTGQIGKVVNFDIPDISAEVRGYGSRFQGELPPLVRVPVFNIRKKATRIFSLQSYVDNGSLEPRYKDYIDQAIAGRKNILVVGGTGTGKTTFLNAALAEIEKLTPDHRIITLEDTPELQCPCEDYSPMFTKQDTGSGFKYDMTRLLMSCMRRSPDRIIVGEVRDGAAFSLLKAWNTGHPGGLSTVHADSAVLGLARLEQLAREDPNTAGIDVKPIIGEAINVSIGIVKVLLPDGTKSRKINDIIEVHGYDSQTKQFIFKHV
jgi:P-type conjugative transfer ATPase TrbB